MKIKKKIGVCFATPLGNRKNKKKFISNFWKFKDEENGNDEDYTMLQYLNLLVNNKCKDKAPEHYKPKYCNSSEELNKAWSKACADFRKLYDKINKIYDNISLVIELNKERNNILEKNNIVNKKVRRRKSTFRIYLNSCKKRDNYQYDKN